MTSNPSKLWLLKSRPLCIICAKPKELETIAKTLGIFKDRISGYDIPEINDGHDFYLGTFKLHTPNGDRDLEFYATSALRQSIQTFTVHAGALFHVLRPKFAIHAGVCAGYVAKDIE